MIQPWRLTSGWLPRLDDLQRYIFLHLWHLSERQKSRVFACTGRRFESQDPALFQRRDRDIRARLDAVNLLDAELRDLYGRHPRFQQNIAQGAR